MGEADFAPHRRSRGVAGLALFALLCVSSSCTSNSLPKAHPRAGKPSVLVFVYDTTRVDAVSAYGHVSGTTPEFDRLAASGLRYTRAFSNAPWTLPSHATLFTGLPVAEHGVGSRGTRAPDDLVFLAERLRQEGYQTAGFSENQFISEAFNMVQGFDQFECNPQADAAPDAAAHFVAEWAKGIDPKRPFFLFINVMDAHEPYVVRDVNRFVPSGVDPASVRSVDLGVNRRLCDRLPPPAELAILRGLYLGDVAAADAKFASVRAALAEHGLDSHLITVATADHGEQLGEHRLMEHNFSVFSSLLHVPLAVGGLDGVVPAVINAPVQLADIVPSIMQWIGGEPPAEGSARPLPTGAGASRDDRAFLAEYIEPGDIALTGDEPEWLRHGLESTRERRKPCGVEDRVFGTQVSVLRYPFHLIHYDRYPPALYDLERDPAESHNLATQQPTVTATLDTEMRRAYSRRRHATAVSTQTLPPAVQEQLRQGGYLDRVGAARPR